MKRVGDVLTREMGIYVDEEMAIERAIQIEEHIKQ